MVMAGFLDFFVEEHGGANVVYATSDTEGDYSNVPFRVERLPLASMVRRCVSVAHNSVLLRRRPIQEAILYSQTAMRSVLKLVDTLRPDLIFVDTVRMARYAEPYPERAIIYLDDLYSVRYERMLRLQKEHPELKLNALGNFVRFLPQAVLPVASAMQKQLLRAEVGLLRRREVEVTRRFQKALLLNPGEARLLSEWAHADNVFVVKPLVLAKHARTSRRFSGEPTFLFLGNLAYGPNRHSFDVFLDSMPSIAQRISNVKILVAGRGADEKLRAKARRLEAHVELLDFVENIEPLMRTCAALVAPIPYGTGVKTKILDALYYGIPILATQNGVDGTLVQNGREALIEDDLSRYADLMERLLDVSFNERMSNAGRALYDSQYAAPQVLEEYRQILRAG
jgi:glycosyltransferase involved in cell wall biosynthesis